MDSFGHEKGVYKCSRYLDPIAHDYLYIPKPLKFIIKWKKKKKYMKKKKKDLKFVYAI